MPDRCIVSSADSNYFPLLQGLILSLIEGGAADGAALCVLDLGLSEPQRAWCRERRVAVADGLGLARKFGVHTARPELVSCVLRTVLPQALPGYGSFLWIDSDAWVQDPSAVDDMFRCAEEADAAAVVETDRTYRISARLSDAAKRREFLRNLYAGYYPQPRAEALSLVPMVNAGVFSARAKSRLWHEWSRELIRFIAGNIGDPFWGNQVAFNELHYGRRIHCLVLPAEYNWLCYFAMPAVDEPGGRLLTPLAPRQAIKILHLAGLPDRTRAAMPVTAADGSSRSIPLTYVQRRPQPAGA